MEFEQCRYLTLSLPGSAIDRRGRMPNGVTPRHAPPSRPCTKPLPPCGKRCGRKMFEFTPAVRSLDEIRAEIAVVQEAFDLQIPNSPEARRLASLLIKLTASERVLARWPVLPVVPPHGGLETRGRYRFRSQ